MDSFPTLQEFVLNLIYDPSARSAFELDPESALHAAGLGDITAADVQQVIPLVVDSAPVTGLPGLTGLTGLTGVADDLTTGVANLDVAGAVSHLQAITSQVALTPAAHLNAEVGGGLSVNVAALGLAGDSTVDTSFTLTGIGQDPAQHLDSHVVTDTHAVTGTHVDTSVVSPVEHVVTGVAPAVGLDTSVPGTTGLLDSGLDTIGDLPSQAPLDHVPGLDVPGLGGATSSIGSVITPDLGHDLTHDPVGTVHDTVGGVTGTVSGVTGAAGDVLRGVTHPAGETVQEPSHGLLGDLHL
ncbi:IniB N-terminal domain-containing protein [Actinoplanes siamensis]|uniref:Uncharacterized protein n=1 Tax=Actinoplanes siamensis TaxID=1223317 RepID=A0A919TKS2_9ACTN|nr:IniB N-terminal domain-containing protein [Actinoplanes siamensis]GIF05455.1 hypothetical protein Asi03nite_29930 [Actinoplanes siamensis]